MDPTRHLIQVRKPFESDLAIDDIYSTLMKGYAYRPGGKKEGDVNNMIYDAGTISPTLNSEFAVIDPNNQGAYILPGISAVNEQLYQAVELHLKPDYEKIKDFRTARSTSNPFEEIGNSHFTDRAATKIAACDAIFKFTGHVDGIYQPQIFNKMFRYSCVAEGPGAFVQYLQYRQPDAVGYGITLNRRVAEMKAKGEISKERAQALESLNWNTDAVDMRKFKPIYGESGTGDITIEWENYSKVIKGETNGVDICTGDGESGIEDFLAQEFNSSKLIFYEALIGILVTKAPVAATKVVDDVSDGYDGGTLFLKILNSVHKITQDIIYIITQCFENVWIHKPISSRPANSERYIIATKRRSDAECEPWIQLMRLADREYQKGMLTRILGDLPAPFVQWITKVNDNSMESMYHYGLYLLQAGGLQAELQKYTGGKPLPVLPQYDLPKALIIWNLPSNSKSEAAVCPIKRPTGRALSGGSFRGRGAGLTRGNAVRRGRSVGFS